MPFVPQEQHARLSLIRTPQVGPVTFHDLISRFGTAREALENVGNLSVRGGRVKALRPVSRASIDDELEATARAGGRFVFHGEPEYPGLLATVDPAPPVIIVKGQAHLFDKPCVGMVGSRNASVNGRKMATSLARELGTAGYIVVSGMARGIDTAAHQGALDTGTIAVLAGGVDAIYPPENKDLYAELAERGAIISEMPLGYTAKARDFPRRNRLISGLSLGIVVVEAALRSGSLITARLAGEQSRDVFAVPGSPLDPRCRGCNQLIKESACLVETVDDITDVLARSQLMHMGEPDNARFGTTAPAIEEAVIKDFRSTITSLLGPTPCEIDDLIRASGAPPAAVRAILTELDLAERLDRLPDGKVALTDLGDLTDLAD